MTGIKYQFPFRKRLLCFPEHSFCWEELIWGSSVVWAQASELRDGFFPLKLSYWFAKHHRQIISSLCFQLVTTDLWEKQEKNQSSELQLKIKGNALAELLNTSLLFYAEENNSVTEYFLLGQLEDFDKMEFNMEIYEVQECWMQSRMIQVI